MANLYRKWSLTPYYFSFLQFVTNMFSRRQFDWCISIGHEIELQKYKKVLVKMVLQEIHENITCFEMVKTSVAPNAHCHFKSTCVFLVHEDL